MRRSVPTFSHLEVYDRSAGKLHVILRLMEEAGAHVIAFRAEGEVRIPAVIRSAAELHGIRVAAAKRRLRTFVRATKDCV